MLFPGLFILLTTILARVVSLLMDGFPRMSELYGHKRLLKPAIAPYSLLHANHHQWCHWSGHKNNFI